MELVTRFVVTVVLVMQLARIHRCAKPNIVMIIADDMGWNDVGFHSGDVPTPNIDALAYHGIILTRHYAQSVCSPSRTALLTGDYPFRHGMQGRACRSGYADGLNVDVKLMPEYFSKLGYKSHLVGKWHLGYVTPEHLPTRRGFNSFFGYLNGFLGYWDGIHYANGMAGRDIRRNEEGVWREAYGKYLTDLLTEEAVNIIKKHDEGEGLLMIVSEAAVHATNLGAQREAPRSIQNTTARGYLRAVAEKLDWSVGEIVQALQNKQALNNTIIVFISDNGAPTEARKYFNGGSNWPMRGEKESIHEGGVRTTAAVWSPLFKNLSRVSDQLFHITDWLPTLYAAAGGDQKDLNIQDGINQWPSLFSHQPGSRNTVIVDIDDINECEAIIKGQWKLIKNQAFGYSMKFTDNYYGENGHWMVYDSESVKNSTVAKLLGDIPHYYKTLRQESTIQVVCADEAAAEKVDCHSNYCLYNVFNDPTECHDLAQKNAELVTELKAILGDYRRFLVPSIANEYDPRSQPKNFNDYWSPWINKQDYVN